MSTFLGKNYSCYQKEEGGDALLVVTCPNDATEKELMALSNACEIARDTHIDRDTEIRVIDESTAVVYSYTSDVIQSLINVDTKVVAFIEVGNARSSVTIVSF